MLLVRTNGGGRRRDHDDGIDDDGGGKEMKQGERADQRTVGLDELPREALCAVKADGEIEAVVDYEAVVAEDTPDVERREGDHGRALVELYRMAHDPVAEVVAPGQRGRRAVGEIVQPGKEAADTADGHADSERQRKA